MEQAAIYRPWHHLDRQRKGDVFCYISPENI
jgi:hypothetical protein